MKSQADLGFDLDCVLAAFALAVTLDQWDSAEAWADRAFRLAEEEERRGAA